MDAKKPTLIIIGGPTAVGKTDLAVRIAKALDTVVVSADSRQCYKEMSIGTAKPTTEEMQGVKHYFIDSISIQDYYSAGDYEIDTIALLDELFETHNHVVMVGGTGLYIQAVCAGLDEFPNVPLAIREELMQRLETEGLEPLSEELKNLDPVYANEVDLKNTQRVIRALEVCVFSGKPFSSFRTSQKKNRSFDTIKICLDLPRQELFDRINQRVDIMVNNGLFEEVEHLLPYQENNAMQTVGYSEIVDFFNGNTSKERAIELVKRNSRRYAKKQLTWFKKDTEFIFTHPGNTTEIEKLIKHKLT